MAFVASYVYMIINLVGAFRYHIGRSLVEQHAMIFMMLAGWYLYRAREGGMHRVFIATFFGILGYWTRQDHLIAVAGLALFAFEPVSGPTGGWKGYWDRIKANWQRLAVFWGGGILSVLAICFRNWWLGGDFYPAGPSAVGTAIGLYPLPETSFYTILTGDHWNVLPSISSIILIPGTFAAWIALVWRPKLLRDYPLSIGTTIVGIFAPYTVIWFGAYAPRFSIHLLPLAIISVVFILNNGFCGFKLPSKLRDKEEG
jgi:hypothetical protein